MNVYQKAAAAVRDRRREKLDAAQLALQAAIQNDDRLYAAYRNYNEQATLAAQGKPADLDNARREYEECKKAAGVDDGVMTHYDCELCHDTGVVDGKYCTCVIKRVISSDADNLVIKPIDFEKAKTSAPSASIKKAYALADDYIKDFPGGKPFFVMTGEPGTGKTMLASAIIGAFMSQGAAAVSVTAFDFMRRALEYHTQFSIPDYTDRFTPMLDCDLLVIDDLGTESILKNVTLEYLYTVVNERWTKRKYTVVTTNLSPSRLLTRYGESIFSRMCDKSRAVFAQFDGKNQRLK